jgi:Winged helix DNA-binding domain
MAARRISADERRARMARRHAIAEAYRALDPVEAARSMVCLHGTDPASVYLSAFARVDGLKVGDLDRELYERRSLVKHLAMRRTLFVFPRDALPFAQAGASARVAQRERRSIIKLVTEAGLYPDADQWLSEACEHVVEHLSDGREATLQELRDAIPLLAGSIDYGTGKTWGGKFAVGPRVLSTLSAGGAVVRASNDGSWRVPRYRWSAMTAWLGEELDQVSEPEGERRLVELWLRAFGPGTENDIKWWLGSTLTKVRRALADLAAVEVDLDGRVGYLLPDDLEPVEEVEPWAALLPPLDPTTMGWFERDWYLGAHRPQLFDRAGNAGATAWWNGRIVGGWAQDDEGRVVVRLLDDVGAEAHGLLQAEAARLEAWLGGVRVPARFPPPAAE